MTALRSFVFFLGLILSVSNLSANPQYVITISVDGLGSVWMQPMFEAQQLPNLHRLVTQGASTLNARTDFDHGNTLPNHTSMITSRAVNGSSGHNWIENGNPPLGTTLATNKGSYIAGMFDIAHDHGLRTAIWSGKSKFSLYDVSYNATHGAIDLTGTDNGRDKIDYAFIAPVDADKTPANVVAADFITYMNANPAHLSFVHFQDPDTAGHKNDWGSTAYNDSLVLIDTQIGLILDMINAHPDLHGKTAIILTADHGGHSHKHGVMNDLRDYTIPFLVWGAGIVQADLYALNPLTRADPATLNVAYSAPLQPVRNGELGNLALQLLGLGPIPGSTINQVQDLIVPEPSALTWITVAFLSMTARIRTGIPKHAVQP